MFDIGVYDLARILAIYCIIGCVERAFRLFIYYFEYFKERR